jgi:uncharacterized protein YndB with AHSA1/START domain
MASRKRKSSFVYVFYIRSTPEKVFRALTRPEITRRYWVLENVSDWKRGSAWKHVDGKGEEYIVGKVLESKPPRRLVISWAFPRDAASKAKHSRVAFDIERVAKMVRLTVKHDELAPGSSMQRGITEGWPRVLSSLKSFLETGRPLVTWAVNDAQHRRR